MSIGATQITTSTLPTDEFMYHHKTDLVTENNLNALKILYPSCDIKCIIKGRKQYLCFSSDTCIFEEPHTKRHYQMVADEIERMLQNRMYNCLNLKLFAILGRECIYLGASDLLHVNELSTPAQIDSSDIQDARHLKNILSNDVNALEKYYAMKMSRTQIDVLKHISNQNSVPCSGSCFVYSNLKRNHIICKRINFCMFSV